MPSINCIIQGSGLEETAENDIFRSLGFKNAKEFNLNGKLGQKQTYKCKYVRRKDIKLLSPNTHLLVVRTPIKRSEKVLSALANGIPIVPEAFIRKVIKDQQWYDPNDYDISHGQQLPESELFFNSYPKRDKEKKNGGKFKGECCVVLLRDDNLKTNYKQILTFGGAKVLDRTMQHLRDRYIIQKFEFSPSIDCFYLSIALILFQLHIYIYSTGLIKISH